MLQAGAIIGIIGGGQLGRMTAMAAAQLGYHCHIYTPEESSPASEVAKVTTVAAYDDEKTLKAFADSVDVVTFEFENIPHASLALLEEHVQVSPNANLLKLSQNRLREKNFINDLEIGTAAFGAITSQEELEMGVEAFGAPAILKTTEMGYDGKGQARIEKDSNLSKVWESLDTKEAILESFVPFEIEVSVIVARNEQGEIAVYPPVQNIHKNHILAETIAPAPIDDGVASEAVRIAGTLAYETELVGLLAVEMFLCKGGKLLVNEIAPRPHNSGHWSMDGAYTSQFEQLVRAICGLPLGNPSPLCLTRMLNLVGHEAEQGADYLKHPTATLHLYGKKETREGRKMGHVNILELDEE